MKLMSEPKTEQYTHIMKSLKLKCDRKREKEKIFFCLFDWNPMLIPLQTLVHIKCIMLLSALFGVWFGFFIFFRWIWNLKI